MQKQLNITVGIFLICLLTTSVLAAGKVLLVQSYHAGYPWTDSIDEGVKKGLEGTGVELEIFYMDTKRKTSEEWKVEAGKLADKKVEEFKPDVVITGDDNAQAYFAKNYAGKAGAPQFVFCGVNAEASKYGYPAENVTGFLERAHFIETIDLLMQFNPGIKKIAIITDKSPTSDATIDYAKTLKFPVEIVSIDQPVTFAEWKASIQKYQSSVDAVCIYMYHTIKESANSDTSLDPKDIIDWTIANNKKPSFGLLPLGIDDGILTGIVESGIEHGFEAAEIAKQIINNDKKAGDFKISTAKKGEIMYNIKTAEKLGIEIPFNLLEAADKIVE